MKVIKSITLAAVCAGLLVAAGCQSHPTTHSTHQSSTVRGANAPAMIGCGSCDR